MSKQSPSIKFNDYLVLWKQSHGEWIPNFVEGKIYSTKTDAYLKPTINSHGYEVVSVRIESGSQRGVYLHRALWVMRYGIPYDSRLQVDHINHNPLDNRLCNLRLVTVSENQRNRPEQFAQAEAIRAEKATGMKTKELAKKYGYTSRMIRYILSNQMYDPAKYPGTEVKRRLHWSSPFSGGGLLRWNK